MKAGQKFALIIGIFFFLCGVMGFIPAFVKEPTVTPDVANLGFTTGYGYLLGIFPINVLHNIVHLVVGLLGILASISLDSSRLYSGLLGIFYGLLTVMGLIPATQSTLGLIPIFGNDVWLHAVTAAIAVYFGFLVKPDLLEISTGQATNTPGQG
ncbi:DUF4383 domain-containing protein [Funiculus sociatus GB2-A5]|uniref:DUF4383 domain-containing protein n=1 Tax=Funiculus sociatus GB2-A5 TaxID=2933946 RepID=A0ABV0JM61_9CYAN|nr:DUF4383 domain-containing protein [Trichocoleus sp. FACHB-6]MBD2064648.1 DUF4383 domain-containing protein [Trichocoleus sp. FACHB-6]